MTEKSPHRARPSPLPPARGLRAVPAGGTRAVRAARLFARMAEEELVLKVQPDAVKKGSYCFVRGNPCKLDVCEVLPKATANGNRRLHIKGPNVFTGKPYEDTLNLTAGFHGIDVPVTSKRAYALMDLDRETGFLSLLTDTGDCKEDVGLTRSPLADQPGGETFDEVGMDISRRFENGEPLRVVVLSVMGEELVVGAEADNDA